MNAIAVWNRLHGIEMRAYASRYADTISKACALAKPSDPLREKGCCNPCDDPFAVSDGPAWQPYNLDDFAEEEAAELVRIRAGGMHGADKDGRGGSIHTPCRPSKWTLGRGERRYRLPQEIAGSDSDPNVARLTGSVELLPLGGATGEHGATGPDPVVGRMGCYRRKSGRC